MPVYEFECSCGCTEESIVPVGTETIKCEVCGSPMRKLISLSSFHLKGKGWAFDNYGLKQTKEKKKE